MPSLYKGENWKEIQFQFQPSKKYAVSDLGRIISYDNDLKKGRLLKGSLIQGYPCLKLKVDNKNITIYTHKLVAEYFIEKSDENQEYVIHLDYNKKNNKVSNLMWASKAEMFRHQQKNPNVIRARSEMSKNKRSKGHKLTAADVIRIKKTIWHPSKRTRLDAIANFYNVSTMQIYRIKTGENWGHIRVTNEPVRDSVSD